MQLGRALRKTTTFITRDLDEAHRIAIMEDGRIVQVGTPGEIIPNPADGDVSGLVAGISKLSMILARTALKPIARFEAEHGDVPADAPEACPEVDPSAHGPGIVEVAPGGTPARAIDRAGLIRAIPEN